MAIKIEKKYKIIGIMFHIFNNNLNLKKIMNLSSFSKTKKV